MDRSSLENWMQAYLRAWNTNDPDDIGRLFAGNAAYYTAPFREPWRGREAIVQNWLDRKDDPGTYSFRYEILAMTGDLGFVRGWTKYNAPEQDYSNLWVIRLDEAGRCTEFTEWWMPEA